jgi:orotate phosphoribosyltransferase-like protein
MEKKAKKVRELLDKGYGIVKISKELKMSTRTIHKIINAQK